MISVLREIIFIRIHSADYLFHYMTEFPLFYINATKVSYREIRLKAWKQLCNILLWKKYEKLYISRTINRVKIRGIHNVVTYCWLMLIPSINIYHKEIKLFCYFQFIYFKKGHFLTNTNFHFL